jgi:hypothetical protein
MVDGEGFIRFRHCFSSKGQPQYTRPFGRLKFQTLIELVTYINRTHCQKKQFPNGGPNTI